MQDSRLGTAPVLQIIALLVPMCVIQLHVSSGQEAGFQPVSFHAVAIIVYNDTGTGTAHHPKARTGQ
jgi:hypothetical protein